MYYSSATLRRVKQQLQAGKLIAFPTESTYGIGCDPSSYTAIRRLLLLKKRSCSKGLIVVAPDIRHITQLADLAENNFPAMQQALAEHEQQYGNCRAISFIAKSHANLLPILSGGRNTIAFREMKQPQLLAQLCRLLPRNSPIIATSANISGQIPQHNYKQVRQIFKNSKSLLVLPGYGKFFKQNSRIISLLDGTIVRP